SRKSPRRAGIRLNRICARTQRPGSGRTSIGATFLQRPTGLTRFMPISIGLSKTCSNRKRLEVLRKTTKRTKIELRFIQASFFPSYFLIINWLVVWPRPQASTPLRVHHGPAYGFFVSSCAGSLIFSLSLIFFESDFVALLVPP